MKANHVKLVYFSPTGTTQKVLKSIAQGIDPEEIESIDLTPPSAAEKAPLSFSDELVLLGAPVYGGRLPVDAIKRFHRIKADNTPAILIVVYGNREFEDALLELKNLAMELGFHPVAGGAFIGEHSFSTNDSPIASGRPDENDVQLAEKFGEKIRIKLNGLQEGDAASDVHIPGRFPYEAKGAHANGIAPVTEEDTCTLCGECVTACPTAAISLNGKIATQPDLCIHCCACIKICPTGSRLWIDSTMKNITNRLFNNCSTRKEPQVFGVEM